MQDRIAPDPAIPGGRGRAQQNRLVTFIKLQPSEPPILPIGGLIDDFGVLLPAPTC